MNGALRTLLETLAASGIIWAATMLFKKAFKTKMSASAHLAVWVVLLARLLVPTTFETGLHFVTLPTEVVQPAASASYPSGAEASMRVHAGEAVSYELSGDDAPAVTIGLEPERSQAHAPSLHLNLSASDIILGVWVAGMLAMGFLTMRGYRHLHQRVRRRAVPTTEDMEELFRRCRQQVGVRWPVRIVAQKGGRGPALMFPDTVLVPRDMQEGGDPEEARHALLHELTHFHYGHQFLSILLRVLEVVYWFNPFVWIAAAEIREDMETFCDSRVVRGLEQDARASYARTVLSFFGRPMASRAVLGISAGDVRKVAERRIRGIYLTSSSNPVAALGALALCAALVFCSFTTVCTPARALSETTTVSSETVSMARPEQAVPDSRGGVYEVASHWDETVSLGDEAELVADVDVLTPAGAEPQTRTVTRRQLTMDKVRDLIDQLAPDTQFCTEPYSDEDESATTGLLWDGVSPTYTLDEYQMVDLRSLDGEGPPAFVHAGYGTGRDAETPKYFQYELAEAYTEDEDLMIERDFARMDEPISRELEDRLLLYQENPIQLAEVCGTARKALADLLDDDVEITSCVRALWRPYSDGRGYASEDEPYRHGALVRFVDAADGVPCVAPSISSDWEGNDTSLYPGSGCVLFTEDGDIQLLCWDVGIQFGDARPVSGRILSLDDVKETFFKRQQEYAVAEYGGELASITVCDVRLAYMLVSDPDNPDGALGVPAWCFTTTNKDDPYPVDMTIAINALDGGVIGQSPWNADMAEVDGAQERLEEDSLESEPPAESSEYFVEEAAQSDAVQMVANSSHNS